MRVAVLFAIAVLVCAGDANAQKFYKWKDADGVTHYTTTPPPDGQQADRLAVDAAPASPLVDDKPAEGQPRDPNVPTEARSGNAVERRSAACTTARANLGTLETNPFVTMDKDGDGKQELLTVDEQNAQIARAREQVRILCADQPAAG
jgi:hypothetical protein